VAQLDEDGQFYNPYEINKIDPSRMLLGTQIIYESFNRGDLLQRPNGTNPVGLVSALAYGGRLDGAPNADVAYVGTATPALYLRSAADGPFTRLAGYTGSAPRDIALDPDNWRRAYVVDDQTRVWRTTDAGATWTEVTGNLGGLSSNLQSIELYGRTTTADDEVLFVGGLGGVFASENPQAGANTTWVRFGTVMPHVVATDVRYDVTDNVLVAGTQGRGAWTVPGLSDFLGSPRPAVDLNGPAGGINFSANFTQGGRHRSRVEPGRDRPRRPASPRRGSPGQPARRLTRCWRRARRTNITAAYDPATGVLSLTGPTPWPATSRCWAPSPTTTRRGARRRSRGRSPSWPVTASTSPSRP
jgi:hypothetical protein